MRVTGEHEVSRSSCTEREERPSAPSGDPLRLFVISRSEVQISPAPAFRRSYGLHLSRLVTRNGLLVASRFLNVETIDLGAVIAGEEVTVDVVRGADARVPQHSRDVVRAHSF